MLMVCLSLIDMLAKEDTFGYLLLHTMMMVQTRDTIVFPPTLTSTGHMRYQVMWNRTTSVIVMRSSVRNTDV